MCQKALKLGLLDRESQFWSGPASLKVLAEDILNFSNVFCVLNKSVIDLLIKTNYWSLKY